MPKIASTSGRAGGLHELARVGVQRLEVAALPLGEQDVEGERALAASRDTPVITVKRVARDARRRRSCRLCSRALCTTIALRDASGTRGAPAGARRQRARAGGQPALPLAPRSRAAPRRCARPRSASPASGVPATTSAPPRSPPSGPRSMIQSAARITSRLCSMTTSEWPASSRRRTRRAASRRRRSAGRWSARRTGTACRARRRLRAALGQVAGELQALRLAAATASAPAGRAAGSRGRRPRAAARRVEHLAVAGEERQRLATRSCRARRRCSARARRRARASPRGPPGGSACRRSRGSAGRRRTGTASRRARSRCRRRSGSGRCRS